MPQKQIRLQNADPHLHEARHTNWLLDYVGCIDRYYRLALEHNNGEIGRSFHIGDSIIRFQGVDEHFIAEITRAFAHLIVADTSSPDLTIYCWSGKDQPYTPVSPALYQENQRTASPLAQVNKVLAGKREAPVLAADGIRCTMYPFPNRLVLLDQAQGVAYYWVEEAHLIPAHERRIPLRDLIAWWFGERNGALVHGAGLGIGRDSGRDSGHDSASGGLLLVGDSGAGKSSTAIACLNSPLCYAADDYCLVSLDAPLRLHSLYSTMQVKRIADLAHDPVLGNLSAHQLVEHYGKYTLYLNEIVPHRLTHGFPLKAILVPQISGQPHTRIVQSTPTHSLNALAPNTIRQMPTVARQTLPKIARLVEAVPSYILELGTERQRIAPAIMELLMTLNQKRS